MPVETPQDQQHSTEQARKTPSPQPTDVGNNAGPSPADLDAARDARKAEGVKAEGKGETPAETKTTEYVVLFSLGDGFKVLDTVTVVGNGGQPAARKIAYNGAAPGAQSCREAVADGSPLYLAAVPKSSWHPKEVKQEQRDPLLDI